MMFRQEYKSFEIGAVTIKIYCDWISPFNKLSGLLIILTQQSMGGNECL